ncbi:MAG: hypothetical protein NTZ43_11625 [Gemmatimonadetes bacterium]|nr:hypothetical protein [Gemmatimonadota bacterium]
MGRRAWRVGANARLLRIGARMAAEPLAWIIATAIVARAWLLFRTPYVPGVNGAYYLVQARALLERGVLGIPDMPLTFYFHAAVAWTLAQLFHLASTDAIVWAVKCSDAVLPPLVAWPVYVLVRRWAQDRGRGDAVPLAAAALSCLAMPWFAIVGELQKNSLALVWLALLMMTLHQWLRAQTTRRGLAVLASLLLLGLTHIGVLGAALVLLGTVLFVYVLRHGKQVDWRVALPWVVAGAALIALCSALVMWKFDSARIQRLITALSNPGIFATDGKRPPGPMASTLPMEMFLPWIAFGIVAIPALVVAWLKRASLPAADVAVVIGSASTVLILTGPWFGGDKMIRFALIALIPAIIAGAFALVHITRPWVRRLTLGIVWLLGVGSGVASLPQSGQAVLTDAALAELRGLSPLIEVPERTLIVAPHGAEWWSAWFLRTRIAQGEALRVEDWGRYDRVLFLTVKPGALPKLIGRAPPPPGGGPGQGRGKDRAPRSGAGALPPREPGMPAEAVIEHDGVYLKLGRLDAPPDFILRGNGRFGGQPPT